jgi:hypothetical protein
MNYLVGLIFLAVAVIVGLYGDRTVQEKGGHVLRVFSWPKGRASQMKWAIAAALGFVGLWFILVGVK